jgi:hypothetical protein
VAGLVSEVLVFCSWRLRVSRWPTPGQTLSPPPTFYLVAEAAGVRRRRQCVQLPLYDADGNGVWRNVLRRRVGFGRAAPLQQLAEPVIPGDVHHRRPEEESVRSAVPLAAVLISAADRGGPRTGFSRRLEEEGVQLCPLHAPIDADDRLRASSKWERRLGGWCGAAAQAQHGADQRQQDAAPRMHSLV